MNEEVQIEEINTQLNPENPQIASVIPDIYSILEEDSYIETGEINHIDKAIELLKLEFFNSASLEIEAGSSEIEENPARTLEIATLFLKSNDYANSIRIIYKNFYKLKSGLNEPYTDYLYYLYYPYGYKELVKKYSSQYKLDPLFTLAVIRQESLFDPDAVSPSEAQGLMQIWPPTGEEIAERIGISNYNVNMLLDPDINVRMGTSYLRQQLDSFGQNEYEYCLGAYNKGPRNMSDWISKRGDKDIDEFIESIPNIEARDYIKIVMGNYYFYQMLYD
jgi:soluble lytic murein transglycosylase